MGQVFSDSSGVLFGGTIEAFVMRLGLTVPQFTPAQQILSSVRLASTFGKVAGVILGCSLGLLNLFFIDTHVGLHEMCLRRHVARC